MNNSEKSLSQLIKEKALKIGFDACGFSKAEKVEDKDILSLRSWLDNNYHGEMAYMANHFDKRINPTLLVENAKSIISVALNYYPHKKQEEDVPQFAYYAYGKDYHDIVKEMLRLLLNYIQTLQPDINGRVFCDTAPLLERYWAMRAGLGFIGKNSLLIIPKKGSYFFLGEIVIDTVLDYDAPCTLSCGRCTRCLEACPTKALAIPAVVNAEKCISYQTIENKGEIDSNIVPNMSNRFYGCDICQQVCPWNRYARPHKTEEFNPSQAFLSLDEASIETLSTEEYQRIFKGSAVKRAKLSGLKRNLKAWQESKKAENNS